jgi:hypothetical protein
VDVDPELWKSVWLPEVVTCVVAGIAVVAAIVVAVVVFVATWRARERLPGAIDVPPLRIYLNEKRVTDIYEVGGYGEAINKQVVKKVGRSREGRVRLGAQGIEVEAGGASNHEVIETYMRTYGAIMAIRVVLKGLEAADGVVYVDLRKPCVIRNKALEQHLEPGEVTADRLNEIECYVWMSGKFSVTGDANGRTTFLAPIGKPPADPTTRPWPQVRVECDELQDNTLPKKGTLHARCLGKVQAWQENDQELVVIPIAMFR